MMAINLKMACDPWRSRTSVQCASVRDNYRYAILEVILKYKSLFLLFSFLIFHFSLAFSQTASEMDTMLTTDAVTAAQAARFVLGAADLLPAGLPGTEAERTAYDMASSNGWLKVSTNETITMKDVSYLIMKAFDLKGGIMYSLFGSPRYAYREMLYRRLITGQTDQNMKVSGARLLLILDRTISNEQ